MKFLLLTAHTLIMLGSIINITSEDSTNSKISLHLLLFLIEMLTIINIVQFIK